MKAVGLITEYNPFHNGHALHIKKALELSGADICAIVMSGDFVQRGEPAVMNKYDRTAVAVSSGADLVIELPVRYSTSSAETFAGGAVDILNSLGVDSICFGSESGDIKILSEIADILASEPDDFGALLKKELKKGISYPAARMNALTQLGIVSEDVVKNILSLPNNILGIEYIKSIKRNAYPIKPITFKRSGMPYISKFQDIRDENISEDSSDVDDNPNSSDDDNKIVSSYAIRKELFNKLDELYNPELDVNDLEIFTEDDLPDDIEFINPEDLPEDVDLFASSDDENSISDDNTTEMLLERVFNSIPEASKNMILKNFNVTMPVEVDDFSLFLSYKMSRLMYETKYDKKLFKDRLTAYEGITESLAGRIANNYSTHDHISAAISKIKDKSLTYTSVSRALIHIILGIKKKNHSDSDENLYNVSGLDNLFKDYDSINIYESDANHVPYVRVLGMDEKGREYLNSIKNNCPVPIITKIAGYEDLLAEDIYASGLYNLAISHVFGTDLVGELQRGIYIEGIGFTGKKEDYNI